MNNLQLIGSVAGVLACLLLILNYAGFLPSSEWTPETKCTQYTNVKELANIDYDMLDIKFIDENYVICTETTMVMVRYKEMEK